MANYFKYIIYFLLGIFDALANSLCSFFKYYPTVDTASMFLTRMEMMRVNRVIRNRQEERQETSKEALEEVEKIRHGKNSSERKKLGQAQTEEKI